MSKNKEVPLLDGFFAQVNSSSLFYFISFYSTFIITTLMLIIQIIYIHIV